MASVAKRPWTYKGETKWKWVVRYTDQLGKRRLKTFEQKKDADRYRTKVEVEIEKGIHTADRESITVGKSCDLWLNRCEQRVARGQNLTRYGSYNYYRTTERHIRPFLSNIKLSQLSAPRVQQWVNDLYSHSTEPRNSPTVKRAVLCLRLAITHAQRAGFVAHNVVKEAPPEIISSPFKQISIPDKDEVRRILNGGTGRIGLIVHIAVLTGMRVSEILALRWRDVDFRNDMIEVRQKIDAWGNYGPPKSKAGQRDIPMAPALSIILKEWNLSRPPNCKGAVFATKYGRPLQKQNFYKFDWVPLNRKIGLVDDKGRPKYHFHALRHVFASLLIERGVAPKVIQRLMGHATISMTFDVYGHLFDDDDLGRSALTAIETSLSA